MLSLSRARLARQRADVFRVSCDVDSLRSLTKWGGGQREKDKTLKMTFIILLGINRTVVDYLCFIVKREYLRDVQTTLSRSRTSHDPGHGDYTVLTNMFQSMIHYLHQIKE